MNSVVIFDHGAHETFYLKILNDIFPRWEKKNPGPGREELTAMQALDLLVSVFDVIAVCLSLWHQTPKTFSPWIITTCSGPPGKRPPSPTGGRGRGRGRGSSMPYYDRYDYNQAHICLFLIFRHFELWPEMSLRSITVNHSSRNRSMDDDLEGRAREREAPSAERGFPKTLFFFSSRILAQV